MIVADSILIVAFGLSLGTGLVFGFGKVFKFTLKSIIGLVVCGYLAYLIANLIYNFQFIQSFSQRLISGLEANSNWFNDFLIRIRIDFIVLVAICFVILIIIRAVIAHYFGEISEIKNGVVKTIDKILGVVFTFALAFSLMLIVFQVIYACDHGIDGGYYPTLQGSFFKLDVLYSNNPLRAFLPF